MMYRFGFLVLLALGPIPSAFGLTLATDGRSDYVIVVSDNANAPENTAAAELHAFFEAVTGARLTIVSESAAKGAAKAIFIGQGKQFRAAFPEINLAELKQDGIVLKTKGDTVYLAGGRPRGTLYAVYTFLEDVLGCRWWTATESDIPKKPTLEIPELNTVYAPKLECREAFYRGAFDGIFAARSKLNGHFEKVAPEYGGHYSILGWCHTFYLILPPGKYFADHPEWYSLIDGKRVNDNAQLCLTNDEMRAEFAKNALRLVRTNPSAGIISISQNDCGGSCQCDKCLAVEAEEGTHSGPIIRFVNAVAEEIEREYPDFLIETLAYSYTRQAPKLVKPRRNVIVRLCSIECSFSQPLGSGPQNVDFKRDIDQWSALAHQLYIWDYVTNFRLYLLPHPNLRVLAPNIRLFVDNKAISLFEQGDSSCTCSDFPELRAWLFAHLMWDPSRDDKALISEFLQGYYGSAAEPIQQYIDCIHDAVERSGVALRCYMEDTAAWMTLEDLNRATECFNEAQRRAEGDQTLSTRVRRARLPLDFAWLNRYPALRRTARLTGKPLLGPADVVTACEQYIRTAESFDVNSYAEGRPFSDMASMLRARLTGPAAPTPKMCEGLPDTDWVAIQDNEFSLAGLGGWSTVAEDEKASDGSAARMPATHGQWAVQYPVSADVAQLGRMHCYVEVRCEAKRPEGNAFQIGIYDGEGKKPVVQKAIPSVEFSDGHYHVIDLGAFDFVPGMYVWLAPLSNPDDVEAIYVDRMVFVREK